MKKWMTAIGVAAVMLFSLNYASAQTPGPGTGHGSMPYQGHGYGPGHGAMHHQEGMSPGKGFFTPEQKATFRELRRTFKMENAQLIGSLVAKRIELQALWTDPKADSKVIMDKEKEFRDLQSQMREKIVELRLEVRKSLTPEQITKLGARWGMGHRFGHGRMMGRRAMMGHGGMMKSEQGMGMMRHRMGGMGMCK